MSRYLDEGPEDGPAAVLMKEPDPIIGDDVHKTINQISEIDGQIAKLREKRQQLVNKVDSVMSDIRNHFASVQEQTESASGRF